jgi:hypothetical protein
MRGRRFDPLAGSAQKPEPIAVAAAAAGLPAANSTFFCDTNTTTTVGTSSCYMVQPAQAQAQHASSCPARAGAIWVPGSYDEQLLMETKLPSLKTTTHYLGLNRSGLGSWAYLDGSALASPQTLSTATGAPFRYWWSGAEGLWAADGTLECAAAFSNRRWCKFTGNESLAAHRANASLYQANCCDLLNGWGPVACNSTGLVAMCTFTGTFPCSPPPNPPRPPSPRPPPPLPPPPSPPPPRCAMGTLFCWSTSMPVPA